MSNFEDFNGKIPKANLLNEIVAVDGAGSTLTADLIDGLDSSQFLRNDQDGTLDGKLTLDNMNVAASNIVANANTIADTFIYDTSKDSDGGAWRKRTQGTSWYNETLNTATRGATKEFPAVALIVAEVNNVTIYDATDPTYPMWMVINNVSFLDWSNNTSVYMINGLLVSGNNQLNTNGTLKCINFIKDYVYAYTNTDKRTKNTGSTIIDRNIVGTAFIIVDSTTIIDDRINDISITVLPDAPIDDVTGLPIPTIAVATNGGVSVIHNNGTIVSTLSTIVNQIQFNSKGGLSATVQNTSVYTEWDDLYTLPVGGGSHLNNEWNNYLHFNDNSFPRLIGQNSSYSVKLIDDKYISCILGLMLLADIPKIGSFGRPSQTDGMINYITKDYQSGWMQGDIKGAYLASTDSSDLVASGELITNGTFDTDASSWGSFASTAFSIVNNALRITNINDGSSARAAQTVSTVAGKSYNVSVDWITDNSTASIYANIVDGDTAAFGTAFTIQLLILGETNTFSFTAQSTQTSIVINGSNILNEYIDIDNVTCKLADEDRSINFNCLEVVGTVTRTPVATGSELMAYSGFSATDYFEQPYNSDLDFGTGDFYMMGWVKDITQGANQFVYDRGSGVGGFDRHTLLFSTSGYPRFYTRGNSDASEFIPSDFGDLATRTGWFFICCRRYANGTMSITIDDKTVTSPMLVIRDVTNALADLKVGLSTFASVSIGGSMSLLRIGAGAPSDDQLKEIYESEKKLFQENTACTLSSTTVSSIQALAYDDDTELLHVAGTDNLDTFDGLVRVDSEVGAYTSLSANNGVIAKGN